jgi:hypothetical protein
MSKRPNPMDLRKSQEVLDAEGWIDPGPYPLGASSEVKSAWLKQHNKMWYPADEEYHEAVQAAMSNAQW